MLITLLSYVGIWIGFGFVAGGLIWFGMITARKRAQRPMLRSEEPLRPSDSAAAPTTTYQVLKGGLHGREAPKKQGGEDSKGSESLLNFPR